MEKFCIVFVLLFLTVASTAQNQAADDARAAFRKGNYNRAIMLYAAAIERTEDAKALRLFIREQEDARICLEAIRQANEYFAQGNYREALTFYSEVADLNESDAFATQRLRECRNSLYTNTQASNQRRNAAALQKKAFKSGDINDFRTFLTKHPNHKDAALFHAYVALKDTNKGIALPEHAVDYIRLGDLFKQHKSYSEAYDMYDYAATFAKPEALYKKFATYKDTLGISATACLALAQAGGYPAAEPRLKNITQGKWYYNEAAADTLNNYLARYQTNLKAFVVVYLNRENYPLQHLNLAHYAAQHLRSVPADTYSHYVLYQFGKIAEELHLQPERVMRMAAAQGNVEAVKWIVNKYPNTVDTKGAAWRKYLAIADHTKKNENFINYAKVLKGYTISAREWNAIRDLAFIDRHERLMASTFGCLDKNDYKVFKNLLKHYKGQKWDKDVINNICNHIYSYAPSKYAKKIKKQLGKLSTSNFLYNKTKSDTYKLIQLGALPYYHYHAQAIFKIPNAWNRYTFSKGQTKLQETFSPERSASDIAFLEYLRSCGGELKLKTSKTAISKNGNTYFTIKLVEDNKISIGVWGRTGNGSTFSNYILPMTYVNGKATATKSDLNRCRYMSFVANFHIEDNKLKYTISYNTAAYASYYVSGSVDI